MWKPGQLVTLWGNVYRITKSCETKRTYVCMLCQWKNTETPCTIRFNYPEKDGFSAKLCTRKMPLGCYPKLLKPNSSGKSTISNKK